MFGKSELVKNVIHKSNMKFEDILNKVKEILRKTYGFNLLIVETAKGRDKNYIVSNALPYVSDPDDDVNNEYPPDANKILLLLILTHTFMMNNSVSEVSLVGFLKKLGIDVEAKHPIFGNVKDYIAKTLVKKHYLNVTGDPITKIQTFSWGPAAETEISMQAILEFVCRVYKNRQPKDWINQFQIASKQNFRNKPEERNFDSLQ
ncbi:non-structural maintenance of chromosomes element 3 homolog isoform X2 [Cylas formicarius]|nr:non-structural maintenance of chromosomes element 3 homolog isoform X2 [Cylas formicarius]